jgi:hypothetical protein
MPLQQNPVPWVMNVPQERAVVILQEPKIQRKHRTGMIHGAALDQHIARDGVFAEVTVFLLSPSPTFAHFRLARHVRLATHT